MTKAESPLSSERYKGHLIERMPWPQPCHKCGMAASVKVDGKRVCTVHKREALP